MGFQKIVELLPPLFPESKSGNDRIGIEEKVERFLEEARSVRDYADCILVADVKRTDVLKLATVEAARLLEDRLRVRAAPVIVVRDSNRFGFLSSVLTAVSLGIEQVMIVWGDDYPASARATNNRDYQNLASAIRDAALVAERARAKVTFMAPVNIETFDRPNGVQIAKERVEAGASILLAQPPTTDPSTTFDRHRSLVEGAGLKAQVMLGVFPFSGEDEVLRYQELFGWKFPAEFHREAAKGGRHVEALAKEVVRRLRSEDFPGVYLMTKGNSVLVESLLS